MYIIIRFHNLRRAMFWEKHQDKSHFCSDYHHYETRWAMFWRKSKSSIFREYSTITWIFHTSKCWYAWLVCFSQWCKLRVLSLVWFRRPIMNTKVGQRCLGSPRSLRPQTRLTASSMETFLIFSTSKIICSFHSILQGQECSLHVICWESSWELSS